jgi:hypothetical protein
LLKSTYLGQDIGFLSAIGFFTELFTMIFIALFAGVISGGVSALFGWGFSGGFGVGVIIGLVLYGVYCVMRMCSDDYTITVFTDGREEKEYESFKGIIGIIVMIVCGILWAVNYFD